MTVRIPAAALAVLTLTSLSLGPAPAPGAPATPPVIPEARSSVAAERTGELNAGNLRTLFRNYGKIGDYPDDPLHVDLSVFHSLEAPKGSGINNSDGSTPFLIARIVRSPGDTLWAMETGDRERQAFSPDGHMQRLEPRPGYFQEDPLVNLARSPAMSDDPRTWPPFWPDKLADPSDPGWPGRWNGFYTDGRVATQETYYVLDDQAYDTWGFRPDANDTTRHGLALRWGVRALQFAGEAARDVTYWYYDITNEGTTPYDGLVFGVYSDPAVGGNALSCDGLYETDDDNAYWERGARHNMAYAWDLFGHGVSLASQCASTGFSAWEFVQTPGDASNGIDDDLDGLVDERDDDGRGAPMPGQDLLRAWFEAATDTARFIARFGPLESRPAYIAGLAWTGDDDLDWTLADDVGEDGVPGTFDAGEGDGLPTAGEPNFDMADGAERDELGLTGFRLNRIARGPGNTDPHPPDGIAFADVDGKDWPKLLYRWFTNPVAAARFDTAAAANWNVAYLAASGPFSLGAGETVRFGLACCWAPTLGALRERAAFALALAQGDLAGPGVAGIGPVAPGGGLADALLGAAPNPAVGSAQLRFRLARSARVSADVLDLQGRVVASSPARAFAAGEGGTPLDVTSLAPGLYFYRLRVCEGASSATRATWSGRLVVVN